MHGEGSPAIWPGLFDYLGGLSWFPGRRVKNTPRRPGAGAGGGKGVDK